MFRRRSSSPASAESFTLFFEEGDHVLALPGKAGLQPVDTWTAARPQAAAALGEAFAAAEDGRLGPDGRALAAINEDRLRLHPAFLARLDAAAAAALDLPPPTALALDLKSQGRINQEAFRVAVRWVRPGGQPVRAELQGAVLLEANGLRRVPEPLWSLHQAASNLWRAQSQPERFAALARLREAWPEDATTPVESDGYLSELRVHHASNLSLKLGRLGAFDFDPVLFGARAIGDAREEGREVDEAVDNVLTPSSQRLFAEDRFRREPGVRPVYVLRDGEYVFIDPSLRPALDVVRRLQDSPEADRRAFVLNPRRTLRDRLGAETADAVNLDELFVETEQFSARVSGVDVWRTPVLPWISAAGENGWLPKTFGLKIGEAYFVLPSENVAPLLAEVEAAQAQSLATAPTKGLLAPGTESGPPPPNEIAVTQQVRDSLEGLRPFAAAQANAEVRGMEEAPAEFRHAVRGKLFLIVRDNLDEVEFAPAVLDPPANTDIAQPPISPVAAPQRLAATLKPHQADGLTWLAAATEAGRPGVLLADDMGLGKTLQALAFMAWLQDQAEAGRRPRAPFLVVAPTGLLGNWRDEIARHLHAPRLGTLVCAFGSDLRGLKEEDSFGARDIETGRASLRAESWSDAGVVLTTYETVRDYHFSFARTRFGLIVYDEVQKLKNPASQLTRAAKTLNAAFVLGMTGTPVENRLQDLWSITDVISPGLLGSSRDFERRHPASDVAALGTLKAGLVEGRPPYMLRRMKGEVLDALPRKHVHAVRETMPTLQANHYRDVVVRAAAEAASGGAGPGAMLQTLAALRSASLHPTDPRQAPSDLDAYARDSARLRHALKVLDDVATRREKALLFVEDLAMQERLASLIQLRFKLAAPPMRINGTVPGAKRQAMVDRFQAASGRFDVMILSPKAGGVGLTLTAANHVIHLSRWWNPAVEDQATDRVFRIGQTRDVHVHLPMAVHPDPAIAESSFDLRLNALIERKRSLTRDLFLPPEAGADDIAALFREVAEGGPTRSGSSPPERQIAEGSAIGPLPDNAGAAAAADVRAPAEPVRREGTLALSILAKRSGARIWRTRSGAPRPTDEITALFAGKTLSHVCIRDPYALATAEARRAQIAFLRDLAASARGIEAVTIEYAEIDGDLPEPQQRSQIGDTFSRSFRPEATRFALRRRPKRGLGQDFHDRFVDIDVRGAGGSVKQHALIFGRGLEALYDQRKECTVSYAPPGA